MFKHVGQAKPGPFSILKKQIEFSTTPGDEFRGIRYYDVSSPILKTLYDLIPVEWHNDFYSSLLVINDNIPPHTDIVETAAFNCYINPGDYSTNIYVNHAGATGVEYADHGEVHIYDRASLTLAGTFTAEPFDIYLINNKMIHEVYTNTLDKPVRIALQLATNKHSYDEVSKLFDKLPE